MAVAISTLSTIAAYLALFILLMCASISDIRKRIVSNKLLFTIVLVWVIWRCAIIGSTFITINASGAMAPLLYSHLTTAMIDTFVSLGIAIAITIIMVVFTTIYERIRDKFAFGGADIKLIAAIALFVPLEALFAIVFIACAISLIYALADMYARKPRGIPFAPCLTCALPLTLLVL